MSAEDQSGSDRLVEYMLSESVDNVPPAVAKELQRCTLDTVAAIVGGHQVEGIDVTTNFVANHFANGSCTFLDGSNRSRSQSGAALANGLAANALDIDEGSRQAEGHPAAVIVPAAIAAAEFADATIGALLDAVLAGYEVAVRVAPALKEWTGMWNGSGSWGAVGAAGAASRLLNLPPESTRHAIGIAEFNAPIAPNQRSVRNPGSSMTKDGIGWGCYTGTTAALLAERGLTGSGTVFDSTPPDGDHLASLGERYYVTEGYYKPYPGCRWAHPGIDAALALLDMHDIDVGAIDQVRVHTFDKALDLGTLRPQNPDQAQYSYPYLLAAAMVKGDWLTPADLNEQRRSAAGVNRLIDRITLHHAESAEEVYATDFTARVEIDANGQTVTSDLTHPLGSPERPMSEFDHRKKQSLLIDSSLGDGTAMRVREIIAETNRPVHDLVDVLTA